MNYRTLGRTGLAVSEVSLGGAYLMGSDPEKFVESTCQVVQHAAELGINYIDTAPLYGQSEILLGEVLAGFSGRFHIATKVGYDPVDFDYRRDSVLWSLERSLQRLRIDKLTIAQIHEVNMAGWERIMEPGGTLEGLKLAQQRGLCDYIGITGRAIPLLAQLAATGEFGFFHQARPRVGADMGGDRPKIVKAFVQAAHADGPVHRGNVKLELIGHFIDKGKRITAFTVNLIDKGDDGRAAHAAHVEQFNGLCFHTLGRVDHHQRGVHCGQHAIGIFREILVTGRVEQVNHVVTVFKLHHRAGNRNAALLFNIQKVGGRVTAALASLHRAGHLNRAREQQQLLGERGLARIRM